MRYEYDWAAFRFEALPTEIVHELTLRGHNGWHVIHCHDGGHGHTFYLEREVQERDSGNR